MKKIVVLLALLTILCLLITATLIVLEKDTQKRELEKELANKNTRVSVQLYEEYHLPNMDNTVGSSPDQTCDINPIGFKKSKYEDEKMVGNFFIIDGLVDEEVEAKINQKLKDAMIAYGEKAYDQVVKFLDTHDYNNRYEDNGPRFEIISDGKTYSYYSEEYYEAKNWKVSVGEAILFNQANALSVMLASNDEFYPYLVNHAFVNVNLIDGEDIKIEDLFTSDFSVTQSFKNALYKELGSGDVVYDEYETWYDEDGEEHTWGYGRGLFQYVDVEKQDELVRRFKYTKDISFGFSDEAVIIEFEGYGLNINLSSQPEKVAVFNKYLKDGLYDGSYDTIKNIPAYMELSKGNSLKYAKCFEKNGKVYANYYIYYNGSFESESKYKNSIKWAIDEINQKVNNHINKLNESYKGNNSLLYSGSFSIYFTDVSLKPEDTQYAKYVNKKLLMNFDFNPEVFELSDENINVLKSDYTKHFYGRPTDYNMTIVSYDKETDDYSYTTLFELKEYRPFNTDIAPELFEEREASWTQTGYYYSNNYNDYYLVDENYRIVSKNEVIDLIVNDKESLANLVFDNIPNSWSYSYISRYNYSYGFGSSYIFIQFPYYYNDNEYGGYWTNYYKYLNFDNNSNYSEDKSPVVFYGYYY